MYIYMYICIYIYTYKYIYVCMERALVISRWTLRLQTRHTRESNIKIYVADCTDIDKAIAEYIYIYIH